MRRFSLRCAVVTLLAVFALAAAPAQKQKREPLSPAEIEKIREAGVDPNGRLGLYMKFLDEQADRIRQLVPRAKGPGRTAQMEDELEDFTALMDELGSNLDQYGDRKADIRKALKKLNETTAKWMAVLHGLAGDEGFELARKEALESTDDVAGTARRLAQEQEDYFKTHKDETGQERAEPKSN